LIADLADGTPEPFDVTPYLPANPFLQAAQVFIRQLINQALVVPKFIVQVVSSIVGAVVKTIAGALGIPTAARTTAAGATAAKQPAPTRTAKAPAPRRTVATSKRQPVPTETTAAPNSSKRAKPTAKRRADTASTGSHGATGHSAR
jgi:hypothetical protein